MEYDFTGKVVIVTGASAGIGEATALLFAKCGAQVVVVGRNEANVKDVAKRCQEQKGQKALPVVADLGTDEGVEKVAKDTIDIYGRVDVLVNNAAVGARTTILKADMATFDRVFNVNIRGVYNLTRLLAPELIKTKGNIVNVSSVMATMVTTGNLPYSLSKAALDHFSRLGAYELAPYGVRVNVVSPGITMTFTILLVGLATLAHSAVIAPYKDQICIAGLKQDREVLMSNVESPYQLALDRDTSTLFFSYTASGDNVFESVYINLKENSSGVIPGITNGFAHAVDKQKQIVYIGGADGIYSFNYKTKQADKLDITDKNIWQLFFKDGLYFTTYPEEKAYVYKDSVTKRVPELKGAKAMLVAFDKNGDLIFYQGGDLNKIVDGRIVPIGDYIVNAFNSDASGNLYFSTPQGIYKFVNGEVRKVTSIDNIYGFAIEGDGTIIYADENRVVRLKTTARVCQNDDEKQNLEE